MHHEKKKKQGDIKCVLRQDNPERTGFFFSSFTVARKTLVLLATIMQEKISIFTVFLLRKNSKQ